MKITAVIFLLLSFLGSYFIRADYDKINYFDFNFVINGFVEEKIDLMDVLFAISSRARVKSDFNWIQFLQYQGDLRYKTRANASDYLFKTVFTDPYFLWAYYWGAMTVAYVNNDYEGAQSAVELGLKANPGFYYLRLVAAWLASSSLGDHERNVSMLEDERQKPGAPILLSIALAHSYEKAGDYENALRVNKDIYGNSDAQLVHRENAAEKIKEIKEKLSK